MSEKQEQPKVGVAVVVVRDGRILLGKRRSGAGVGHWGTPGGMLDMTESFERCARRETREETGLVLRDLRYVGTLNDVMPDEGRHYITIWYEAAEPEGALRNPSPEETERWEWYSPDSLPDPLYASFSHLLRRGYRPGAGTIVQPDGE